MLLTRFLASRSVCSRGERGKLDMAIMSLSVKSIASWSYSAPAQPLCLSILRVPREKKGGQGRSGSKPTFAAPKFSIAGILWPAVLVYDINFARLKV